MYRPCGAQRDRRVSSAVRRELRGYPLPVCAGMWSHREMAIREAICFGCDVVRQIDPVQSGVRCNCGGNTLPLLNLDAFRTARLAHRLGGGYYVHSAIIDVAAEVDRSQPINWSITREVVRKDGTRHVFSFDHYLR